MKYRTIFFKAQIEYYVTHFKILMPFLKLNLELNVYTTGGTMFLTYFLVLHEVVASNFAPFNEYYHWVTIAKNNTAAKQNSF